MNISFRRLQNLWNGNYLQACSNVTTCLEYFQHKLGYSGVSLFGILLALGMLRTVSVKKVAHSLSVLGECDCSRDMS